MDLESVVLAASLSELTTRETVTFTLTGHYDDGSDADVTADASFVSGDEAVLFFWEPSVGQPLDGGTVTVTGSYGGLEDSVDLTITLAEVAAGDLVVNELLADATVDGDPNGAGSTDSVEDEFIEIANMAGVTLDLSGVMIVESDWGSYLPRHTFAEGTTIRPGSAIVVFGGGDVSAMVADNVGFLIADNDDPGTPYGLSLLDAGETVRLLAADGTTVLASLSYGSADLTGAVPAAADQSITLDPDVTGSTYVAHESATGATTAFSPGTYVDGTPFGGPAAVFGP